MNWRVAQSLDTLRKQVNAMAPGRSVASDGTIGDAAHSARTSDHNPNDDGVVTAMDITNDPLHGLDSGVLAEQLRVSQDPRIKYVISNSRIFSSKEKPWTWRPYTGTNAHTKHVHVSVMGTKALYDDTRPWAIDQIAVTQEPPRGMAAERCTDIVATVFGGATDPETSAYDGHRITDSELGVALPARVANPRPQVRVTNPANGRSIVCNIVDVGPWNTDDPYWENGGRPQAESGTDHRGRPTNHAGIDLTPAAARAIGIPGKGKVDWAFVGAAEDKIETGEDDVMIGNPVLKGLRDAVGRLEDLIGIKHGDAKPADDTRPKDDLTAALGQLVDFVKSLEDGKKPAPDATTDDPAAKLRKVVDLINAILGASGKPPLGPVNGMLGDTIGNLLNGKKSMLGIVGAVLTQILGAAGPGSALEPIIAVGAKLGLAGLSGPAMPIFLALSAWGVLGKLEKWVQTIAAKK